jgi:hypothetical protein
MGNVGIILASILYVRLLHQARMESGAIHQTYKTQDASEQWQKYNIN